MTRLSISNSEEHGPVSDVPLRKIDVEGLAVEVPSLLVDCFSYILENGLVEGIFRVSGSIKRMRDVTADYATYQTWLEKSKPSPHDVAGVTKKFTREYLQSIGGLFPPQVLASLRELFVAHPRKNSMLSTESYRSASTSYSSGLESVCEETADTEYTAPRSNTEKLDSVATLLVTKNQARKNALLIYYLSVLKVVSAHQENTRMPNANLAIVFQQYLFETWVVTELQSYQGLLEFLLDHYDAFVAKYRSNLGLLGGLEEVEQTVENVPMMFSDSISTSPLTDYSSHHASPPKFSISGSFDGGRRSSLSQKFNSFWDAYASPVNRSKRFSFMSRGSGRSSDRLPLGLHEMSPQASVENTRFSSHEDLTETNNDYQGAVSETRETSREPSICSRDSERLSVARRGSKRISFMGFSRSKNASSVPDVTVAADRENWIEPRNNIISADSLVLGSSQNSFPIQEKRQSISRRFSIWFKRK